MMESLLDHIRNTSEGYRFQVDSPAPGVRLHVQPTKRFKSVTVKLYQLNPLSPLAAERALVPMVLRCGCEGYPTRKDIALRMQALYGATLNVNAGKFGHTHMQKYELSYVSSRYLNDTRPSPEASFPLLQKIITRPVTEEGAPASGGLQFRSDSVERQRKQLLDLIDSRKEDQQSYAIHRCVKYLYMEDPYRFSKYGTRERVNSLTPDVLFDQYASDLSTSRFDVVVTGDVEPADIEETMQRELVDRLPERQPESVRTVSAPSPSGEPRRITESGDGEQSWLVMGFQTSIVMGHPRMYELSMMAGLFGGFPHSKLHRQIREERGLAYDIRASIKRSVGLLLVTAGVEQSRVDETVEAVRSCRREMADGTFSDQELEMTRRKLLEQLVNLEDSPSQKADSYHNRYLAGRVEELSEIAGEIMEVTDTDVREVAGELNLQMIYCLE